eukprot:585821-Hanusia_phi.AAC.1
MIPLSSRACGQPGDPPGTLPAGHWWGPAWPRAAAPGRELAGTRNPSDRSAAQRQSLSAGVRRPGGRSSSSPWAPAGPAGRAAAAGVPSP